MATAEQALQWVNKLYRVLVIRRPAIEKQFDYFQGKQPLVYATDQWKQFHESRYQGFADNWCGVVGRAPVDRLRIDGFSLGDASRTPQERQLWDDWQRNELDLQSMQGFLASTIAKRSATLVWGDKDDTPVVTWEHPAQVIVWHADDGSRKRLAALKSWISDDDREYATLYLPDSVWKFSRPAWFNRYDPRRGDGIILPPGVALLGADGGWEPRQPPEDDAWPIANPLGEVPVIEWPNRPLLGGDPLSDIDGTMAMQDAINMLWAYMFAAADYASMPARVVTNAEPPKIPILDQDGQIIGSKPAKLEDLAQGRLLFLPGVGNNARIDQWDAAKLDVFTASVTEAVGHIAAQTSTPDHYLRSNQKMANLNADALTAAETPLVTKVDNSQLFYNPAAKETLRLMALVRGETAMADRMRMAKVIWKDAAMHSLAQISDAATKDRSIGMSLQTVLEDRYGMDPDRVQEEMRRIDEEQSDPVLAQVLKMAQSANPADGNPGNGNADAGAGT